jgi:very-short-patch-repair endonuclease
VESGPERTVSTLAATQLGLFTIDQARQAGMTDRVIRHRRSTGAWRRVGPGVFAIAGAPTTWHQRLLACCLGRNGWASHESAAELHGIGYLPRGHVVVTVGPDGRNRSAGIGRVHESNATQAKWFTSVGPVPVTTPARTIIDLAAVLRVEQLARALDDALGRGAVGIAEEIDAFNALAVRGRRGVARLRPLLEERGAGVAFDTTHLERMFSRLVRDNALPEPDRQVLIGLDRPIGTVDFVFRSHGLIVEVDGRLGHSQLLDFESDRRRDQQALVAGFRVVRFTYRQLRDRPDEVVEVLRALLR